MDTPWWLEAIAVINSFILIMWFLLSWVKDLQSLTPRGRAKIVPGVPLQVEQEHIQKFPYDQ